MLGCGFDPGVISIYCAYAQETLFDEIHTVDIIDCNAGNHGQPFATNFNPEINIREVTAARTLLGGRTLARNRPAQRLDDD